VDPTLPNSLLPIFDAKRLWDEVRNVGHHLIRNMMITVRTMCWRVTSWNFAPWPRSNAKLIRRWCVWKSAVCAFKAKDRTVEDRKLHCAHDQPPKLWIISVECDWQRWRVTSYWENPNNELHYPCVRNQTRALPKKLLRVRARALSRNPNPMHESARRNLWDATWRSFGAKRSQRSQDC